MGDWEEGERERAMASVLLIYPYHAHTHKNNLKTKEIYCNMDTFSKIL